MFSARLLLRFLLFFAGFLLAVCLVLAVVSAGIFASFLQGFDLIASRSPPGHVCAYSRVIGK